MQRTDRYKTCLSGPITCLTLVQITCLIKVHITNIIVNELDFFAASPPNTTPKLKNKVNNPSATLNINTKKQQMNFVYKIVF